MNAYEQALALAAQAGHAFYVNRHGELLLAQAHRERLCCAIAHPSGTLEWVVQGYSHAVALSAGGAT